MNCCNVCAGALGEPVYRSAGDRSFTTMNTPVGGRTEVHFCARCGHLQTSELPDLAHYYAKVYEINLASAEADQLYQIVDGQPVYRADHQARVLRAKVEFPPGCRVLDYGCAQAATLRKVVATSPGIRPFLFDVTDKYVGYWERFPVPTQWATHQVDPAWAAGMDVVLSFFAFEHIAGLERALADIKALLKPGGTFYLVVPNVLGNAADFIVADHVNHFTPASMRYLLAANGFDAVEVDDEAHDAALVVTARLAAAPVPRPPLPDAVELGALAASARQMSAYWNEASARIRAFEADGDGPCAIYGAGFYGNFIAASLASPERVDCFVDRNKHLHGQACWGRPVVAPDELPENVRRVLVGVNPRAARGAIEAVEAWRGRGISFFYL